MQSQSRYGWRPLTADRLLSLMRSWCIAALMAASWTPVPWRVQAQTDYYNTDRGRPVQIEDAYVAERYAIELKLAPVRVERERGGVYNWGVEPEIAYGIFPRTHIEVGLPVAFRDAGVLRRSGVAGLEVSAMHNLNAETEGVPALGLRADVLLPVGSLAPARTYPSITGIATRTFTSARVHLNATYTAGSTVAASATSDLGDAELSRWLVGGAVDKTFPLRATLITAEFYGRQSFIQGEPVEYTTGVGVRRQVSPTLALDGGVGRRLNGDTEGWYLTFGSAYAFSVPSFLPGGR
jgi:hypothetical protein